MWIREFDYKTPAEACERLQALPYAVFLDSAQHHTTLGRYSYVTADPFQIVKAGNGIAPLEQLRKTLSPFRGPRKKDLPPFHGGAVGYISYDYAHNLESLPRPRHRAGICDNLHFGLYDTVLAFDHRERTCRLIATGYPETDEGNRELRGRDRLDQFTEILNAAPPQSTSSYIEGLDWRSNFTQETYCAAVEKVRDYIRAGDIYQANLSQRFTTELPDTFNPWTMYRRLRRINPAPFGAFLQCGNHTIASSSPERFLSLKNGEVETRPIKGTIRRRPEDPDEDARRAQGLLASHKDRAENIMIVDLLRNDLSKVCEIDSIETPALCGLETYASVHHLTSVVTGRLRNGQDAQNLIAACFPGGSITGAPKIRAMEIITELEGRARELFCGSIGWIGFNGDMDLNIAIRTAFMNDKTAVLQAGGGITILSDPQSEYDETLAKAQRVFDAFAPEAS